MNAKAAGGESADRRDRGREPSVLGRPTEKPTAFSSLEPSFILLTGATGYLGRALWQPGMRALVRRARGMAGEIVGSLENAAALARACDGVQVVWHAAGLADADARDAARLWQVNVEGTRRLLAAAAAAGVERFVFFSSVKAMGEPGEVCVDEHWPVPPTTAYGSSKRAAEEAVLEAGARTGMAVVVLRLAPVYGRGGGSLTRLARAWRAGWLPRIAVCGNRRSFVHLKDVVAVTRVVSTHPAAAGQVFIVAHPQAVSTATLCEMALAVPPARRGWGKVGEKTLRRWGRWLPPLEPVVSRLCESAWYSPARLEKLLGWRAQVALKEGLAESLRALAGQNLAEAAGRKT